MYVLKIHGKADLVKRSAKKSTDHPIFDEEIMEDPQWIRHRRPARAGLRGRRRRKGLGCCEGASILRRKGLRRTGQTDGRALEVRRPRSGRHTIFLKRGLEETTVLPGLLGDLVRSSGAGDRVLTKGPHGRKENALVGISLLRQDRRRW